MHRASEIVVVHFRKYYGFDIDIQVKYLFNLTEIKERSIEFCKTFFFQYFQAFAYIFVGKKNKPKIIHYVSYITFKSIFWHETLKMYGW